MYHDESDHAAQKSRPYQFHTESWLSLAIAGCRDCITTVVTTAILVAFLSCGHVNDIRSSSTQDAYVIHHTVCFLGVSMREAIEW